MAKIFSFSFGKGLLSLFAFGHIRVEATLVDLRYPASAELPMSMDLLLEIFHPKSTPAREHRGGGGGKFRVYLGDPVNSLFSGLSDYLSSPGLSDCVSKIRDDLDLNFSDRGGISPIEIEKLCLSYQAKRHCFTSNKTVRYVKLNERTVTWNLDEDEKKGKITSTIMDVNKTIPLDIVRIISNYAVLPEDTTIKELLEDLLGYDLKHVINIRKRISILAVDADTDADVSSPIEIV